MKKEPYSDVVRKRKCILNSFFSIVDFLLWYYTKTQQVIVSKRLVAM